MTHISMFGALRVNRTHRDRSAAFVRIDIGADDPSAISRHILEAFPRYFRYLALRPASPQGLRHAALPLDFLGENPGMLRQRIGKMLDKPGAPGRIDDLRELALRLKHELLVPGHACRELVGRFAELVKATYLKAVASAQDTGEGFHGGAEHVHVRIMDRLVEITGTHAKRGTLGFIRTPKPTNQPRPQGASRPQLGDLNEKPRPHRKVEPDPRRHPLNLQSTLAKSPQILQ